METIQFKLPYNSKTQKIATYFISFVAILVVCFSFFVLKNYNEKIISILFFIAGISILIWTSINTINTRTVTINSDTVDCAYKFLKSKSFQERIQNCLGFIVFDYGTGESGIIGELIVLHFNNRALPISQIYDSSKINLLVKILENKGIKNYTPQYRLTVNGNKEAIKRAQKIFSDKR